MQKKKNDPLKLMREQLIKQINAEFDTVEAFCWDKDLNKATVSNFLHGKKDFRVSTLVQIAEALKMNLIIKLD